MADVQHGEAQDVGLVAHHVLQPQQREVLGETTRGGVTSPVIQRFVEAANGGRVSEDTKDGHPGPPENFC